MSELRIDRSGTTLTLTLNRPEKMNALSSSLVESLLETIAAAHTDGTRLLVLRGNGKNFSAGFDFGDYEAQSEGDLVLRFIRIEQLLQAVYHAPFDTLALAHGKNFGAGVDLICSCARRVATADATFRMPGLRFGLVLGTRRFAHCVGAERARHILQTGQTFSGEEARGFGFLHDTAAQDGWPSIIEKAADAAVALPTPTASRLFDVIRPNTRDEDLAELVRSATEPGIKARIRVYLGNK